jgi:type II secretory pathway component GspD/PulD (secretin)
VLEWFADRADLSLVVEVLPVGSFTYRDDRAYEVDQALDLLNSYLLTRGYTLVRRERLLLVIDLESPIPEELITLVTLEELDQRGRYELVKCVFPLARMTADEARRMIEGFLGPQGMVIAFPAARQILVTETAGKLRTIRDMIARVEDPKAGGMERIVDFQLNHVIADEVLAIARPLLGLGADQNFNSEISISVDPVGTRIFATGKF